MAINNAGIFPNIEIDLEVETRFSNIAEKLKITAIVFISVSGSNT